MIRLEKIKKEQIKMAVDGIEIDEDSRIIVTGNNGNGKTTLIRMISGIVLPDCGEYHINNKIFLFPLHNHQLNSLIKEINQTVFYLEGTKFLYPYLTVEECILYYSLTSGILSSDVFFYLNALFFNESKFKKISELSLGTKQKIADAFCLASSKQIIVCDEPTLGLDKRTKSVFLELLLSKKKGLVISTNDESLYDFFGTRINCSNNKEFIYEQQKQ